MTGGPLPYRVYVYGQGKWMVYHNYATEEYAAEIVEFLRWKGRRAKVVKRG